MKFLCFILLVFSFSCTTFSKYSVYSKEIECDEENTSYICYSNDSLKWSYTSFGGVKFVNNKSDFKKLKIKAPPRFKNVLLYGSSKILNGDYYILLDNKIYPKNFIYRDTIISNNKITIAVSEKIEGKYNKNLLINGLR